MFHTSVPRIVDNSRPRCGWAMGDGQMDDNDSQQVMA